MSPSSKIYFPLQTQTINELKVIRKEGEARVLPPGEQQFL